MPTAEVYLYNFTAAYLKNAGEKKAEALKKRICGAKDPAWELRCWYLNELRACKGWKLEALVGNVASETWDDPDILDSALRDMFGLKVSE
jgi:hypothetical protein